MTYIADGSTAGAARFGYTSVAVDDLRPSDYVILGFLRLGPLDEARHGPRSGYDVKRAADLSVRQFWNISPVQVYPGLKRLEAAGLVAGRSDARGRRPRRVYELTPAGEEALREWLRSQEPLTFELRDLGLLKLFFADALETAEALDVVRAIRQRAERSLETLEGESRAGAGISAAKGDRFPMAALELGVAMQRAVRDYCAELEASLERPVRRPRRSRTARSG